MGQRQVAFEGGALVASRFGRTRRRVEFPFGATEVVEWTGTEPLTVPRHTRVERVRSYVRVPMPGLVAHAAPLGRFAAPLVRLSARALGDLTAADRERTRWTVVGEARNAAGGRRATLTGRDVYGLTALLLVRAAEALRLGEIGKAGALAPAEAFDPRSLIARLEPLAEPPVTEDF
jgi:hypothetical protein